MEGWSEFHIKDIGEVIGGGTPSTENKFYYNGQIPWITPKDLTNYNFRFIARGERNISELGLQNSSARLMPKGTVLMTSRAPIGYLAISSNPVSTNQGFKSIIVNQNIANNLFVYYLLLANIEFIKSQGSGTTFAEISGSVFKELSFILPPLPLQHRIAEILGALDDKIELNRQMNQTLEQMAQAIYKHRFVDDIDPENLPEGWKIGLLDEVVNIRGGGTPSTIEPKYWNGSLYWTSPKDLANLKSPFLTDTASKLTELGLQKVSSGILPINTILLSSRAPIGYIAIADIPVAINQGYIAILPDSSFSRHFMYFWLKNNLDLVIQYANGSTFLEISKKAFRDIECIIPPDDIIQKFNHTVQPDFDFIKNSTYETEQLIKIRDSLLPKLISGELIPANLHPIEQVL